MTKDKIYRLAIASGFKPKIQPDNTMDLNPYVYDFAERLLGQHDMMGLDLIAQIRIAAGDPKGKLMQDQLVEHIAELKAKTDKLDALNSRIAKHSIDAGELLCGSMVVGLDYIEDLLEP